MSVSYRQNGDLLWFNETDLKPLMWDIAWGREIAVSIPVQFVSWKGDIPVNEKPVRSCRGAITLSSWFWWITRMYPCNWLFRTGKKILNSEWVIRIRKRGIMESISAKRVDLSMLSASCDLLAAFISIIDSTDFLLEQSHAISPHYESIGCFSEPCGAYTYLCSRNVNDDHRLYSRVRAGEMTFWRRQEST